MDDCEALYGIRKADYARCANLSKYQLQKLIAKGRVVEEESGKILVSENFLRVNIDFLKDVNLKRRFFSHSPDAIATGLSSIVRRIKIASLIRHEEYVCAEKDVDVEPIIFSEDSVVFREKPAFSKGYVKV